MTIHTLHPPDREAAGPLRTGPCRRREKSGGYDFWQAVAGAGISPDAGQHLR
ncbi:hypothetical protein ASZ90_010273 [hydrocarbon metagenome]|uniref:Uncharacterized protein n=1 Tax=hydrocarbon metagenome TaxID=938273 RepID=A0A0W8FGM6_9ZZZZ